ncbi:MAG: triose-phosphate isomerase [Gammaproteobacteria bacterium]|nr:triose-phosphate isomerase [Gammaproteobacteria bacterium]
MRQKLIVGNWKMHGSRASVNALIADIRQGIAIVKTTQVAVCPPVIFLGDVEALLKGTPIAWGAQNLCDQPSGAYTGEISADMLREFGCRYVIVGHSERRALYGEGDVLVARKYALAVKSGLIPIFCVGELLAEREAGQTEAVVARQLDAVLNHSGVTALQQGVVAYEPVWAIGTGKTATPEQAQQVHAFIRERVARHDATIGAGLQILYGGSVKAANAAELFRMPDIDGGLIGGASLNAVEFLAICQAAG